MCVRTPWKRNSTEATVSNLPRSSALGKNEKGGSHDVTVHVGENFWQSLLLSKETKTNIREVKGHVCILTGNSKVVIKVTSKRLCHYCYFAHSFPWYHPGTVLFPLIIFRHFYVHFQTLSSLMEKVFFVKSYFYTQESCAQASEKTAELRQMWESTHTMQYNQWI